MSFLLISCPFNGNTLRILEKNEFLCKFHSLGSSHISKMSQCAPEVFLMLFRNQQEALADSRKKSNQRQSKETCTAKM